MNTEKETGLQQRRGKYFHNCTGIEKMRGDKRFSNRRTSEGNSSEYTDHGLMGFSGKRTREAPKHGINLALKRGLFCQKTAEKRP